MPPEQLSRLVSHALRHEPWLYELELDEEGWVPIEALLAAIHERGPRWSSIGREQLALMIASSEKRRHEMTGDRIRALYGHSVPGRLARVAAAPPDVLFHGTSPGAWQVIHRTGLRPMGRQYVHLSTDVETAAQVGRRKTGKPVILTVDAARAHREGTEFWRGNEVVWLADHVAPAFLSVHPVRPPRDG